jgi:hypothetical protein
MNIHVFKKFDAGSTYQWSICSGENLHNHCYSGKIDYEKSNQMKSYACIAKNCFSRYCYPCGKVYLEGKKEA